MTDYFNLGTHHRPITTNSPDAQLWFDRGLLWCYGFNHEEAVNCFNEGLKFDPDCAMLYWGIAYAKGPNYNRPWDAFSEKELAWVVSDCQAATQEALLRRDNASLLEQSLIHTLEKRYQSNQIVNEDEFCVWNDDYANALRLVYAAYPEDADVATLFAEALINRTPWQLWDLPKRTPAEGASTIEAVQVLEESISRLEDNGDAPHPGLLHLYIHAMEMSPHPEKALRASDTLRYLVPDSGHLRHMPSHIDILCGHYYDAVIANDHAIQKDLEYLDLRGIYNFYAAYVTHNYHFKIYAAMLLGQYGAASQGVAGLNELLTDELLRIETPPMVNILEGMLSMRVHVLIRFGQWQAILEEPFPDDRAFYCNTTAMLHYARGIAHSALGQVDEAEQERVLFQAAAAQVPEERYIFNNTCIDVLAIAAEMLNGELEYRKGNYDEAYAHLRQAVYLDDNLAYAEPWGWMHPTRHALGALLLEQGHVEEAAAVYRADLGLDQTLSRPLQHPDNVWSLHGYEECLRVLGKADEAAAVKLRLDIAMARTDVTISASCFCRNEDGCCGG